MKLRSPDRHGIFNVRAVFAIAAAICIPLAVFANAPSWWSQRGVLVAGANANDYAPANQGQLKNIAKAAMVEMDAKLPGGAGEVVHGLVDNWSNPTAQTHDFAPVNLGQLKTVAKPFYDRLISVGLAADYPWTGSSAPANDFAAANLGQVKKLFSFEPGQIDPLFDGDGNGLPDGWEREHFGGTGVDPNADPDGDGLTNLQEFQEGRDPNDFYNGITPIIQIVSGNNQQSGAGAFAPLPLIVRVMDSQGIPLANAPVIFTVSAGGGRVAATPQMPLGSTQGIRTAADATAAVFYQQPVVPNVTGHVVASVGPRDYPATVVFNALSQATPPIPLRGLTATPSEVVSVLNPRAAATVPIVIRNETDEPQQISVAATLPTFPSYTDSTQQNGPAFVWNDISGTGTHLSALSNHDISFQPLEIGFNFPFFGDTYHTVYVSAHGYVTFGSGSSAFSSRQMPSTQMPANIVAGYSTLMSPRISGDVFVKEELDRVTIQYTNMRCHFQGGSATFQIILQRDGTILFYYKDMVGPMNDGTIGIQNGTRDTGLTVASNTAYVTNNLAVRITDAKHRHVATSAPPGAIYNGSHIDSDQPEGPAYVWDDISGTGTLLNSISNADDSSESLNISFAFPFFEKSYQTVWVSSNGFVTFGSGSSVPLGLPLPTGIVEAPMIAGLWSDLDPGTSGDIFYEEKPGKVIIQFNNVARYDEDGFVTFQIVLHADGSTLLYYKQLVGNGYLGTLGLQGSAQTGMTVSHNQPYLKNNFAVRLEQLTQWLTVSPPSATLAPGASINIDASLDARFLQSGSYEAKIDILSPATADVGVRVPVSLRINTGPQVIITAPAYGASYIEGQAIVFEANAQDVDGIAKVEYFDGTTKLGEATTSPFALPAALPGPGSHTIRAHATDALGMVGISDPIDVDVQADADHDGLVDSWEQWYFGDLSQGLNDDPDGDGLSNLQEFNLGTRPNNADTDGDGLADGDEVNQFSTDPTREDMDGDGLSDGAEVNQHHTDPKVADSDGDGMRDGYEVGHTLDPLQDDREADRDNDGLTNFHEFTIGTDPARADTDGDGLNDAQEVNLYHTDPRAIDSDRDEIPDGWEVAHGLDPLSYYDGDADTDGDGVSNRDEWRLDFDPHKADTNDDGVVDTLADRDADGLPDVWELKYFNSATAAEAAQDSDLDGLQNIQEYQLNTAPTNPDTDGDLLTDAWEVQYGFNPRDAAGENGQNGDADGDGLSNFKELIYRTSPRVSDSDGDGVSDGAEVAQGSFPNQANDGGNAPTPDQQLTVKIIIGDPSGSHSERWSVRVKDLTTQQIILEHQSESYGALSSDAQSTFKQFRRGHAYELQLVHLGTKPELLQRYPNFYPDYDWALEVSVQNQQGIFETVTGKNAGNFLALDPWDPQTSQVSNTVKLLVNRGALQFPWEGQPDRTQQYQNQVASKRVILLPVEITKLWSDQLTGVTDANYLPNKTGQGDRPYLLMGAAQSNNFDLKGHLKATVNVPGAPELRNKILWRLAGKSGGTYIPENGTSTYASNGDEVTIVLDNPRTDEENSYYLVAGYDQDGNGQLNSAEAGVVPKYKWSHTASGQTVTEEHDHEVKIVARSTYNQSLATLTGLSGDFDDVGLSQASRFLSAFLTQSSPTGSTSTPTPIARNESGLTHSVGVLFQPPGNPGMSISAEFAPPSQMTTTILESNTLKDWLASQFEGKRVEVENRFLGTNNVVESFIWDFSGDLNFSMNADPDLFFSLGKTKIVVRVEVEVDRALYVVTTALTGSVMDLTDFDYDDRSGYGGYGDFIRDGARVQAGYNTLGIGGRVFKSNVKMLNSPVSMQFRFQ